MIDDFNKEVEERLDIDEIIKDSFIANNYKMLKESPEFTALSSSALMGTVDYSFNYHFIITNKRVFIGNTNPYFKVISYDLYNLDEIKDINVGDFKEKSKKLSFTNLYYCLGIFPIILVAFILLQLYLTRVVLLKNSILINSISLIIPSCIIYIAYILLKKISKPKLIAKLRFKDDKEIIMLLKKKNQLDSLKLSYKQN